eukprot:357723-Chlamydomonas_euryale.AAC.33
MFCFIFHHIHTCTQPPHKRHRRMVRMSSRCLPRNPIRPRPAGGHTAGLAHMHSNRHNKTRIYQSVSPHATAEK